MLAVFIGIISSIFFSATFVVTKMMGMGGTNWGWTSFLRFALALPFLFLIVLFRGEFIAVLKSIKKNFFTWLLWGNLAGVGFYALLSFSSDFAPSWLVASTWQVTILAGLLLSPLFFVKVKTANGEKLVRGKIPIKRLFICLFILVGVILMQVNEMSAISLGNLLKGFIPVVIAAFFYPLGNRKLMSKIGDDISPFQRAFGVTLVSMPLGIIFMFYGYSKTGFVSKGDLVQALILALFSGVIATVTFFIATSRAKHNLSELAAVESTQAGMVIFTAIGSVIFIGQSFPTGLSLVGMIVIIVGMILNSFIP